MKVGAVARILKPFFPRPAIHGMELVRKGEAAVFCANHQGWYGPVVLMLYGNVGWRPWVNEEIMDRDRCSPYLLKDFIHPVLRLHGRLGALLSRCLAPLCIRLMEKAEAIPVHHGSRKILETFRITEEALEEGRSILLFPETPSPRGGDKVQPFQKGFAGIAREYWEKTGKALIFYPVYVDRRHRAITFGEGVSFQPQRPWPEEKERIVQELEERIRAMEGRAGDDL